MNYSCSSAMQRECDACRSAAAAVYCRADDAALCAACDADIHAANPISRRHLRVPVGSAYADAAPVDEDRDRSDYDAIFGDDVDEYLDLGEFDSCVDQEQRQMDSLEHVKNEYVVPVQTHTVSLSSMDNTTNCMANSYIQPPTKGPIRFDPTDREARVLRYREKRKNRKFEKTIRYASRKAYAEARPRIKGRFAKRANVELEIEQMFSNYVASEDGYGIVPTY